MKYIGNYKDEVDKNWYTECLTITGESMPKNVDSSETVSSKINQKLKDANYNLNNIFWWKITSKDVSFDISKLSWITGYKFNWWISKTMPGNFIPMHSDSIDSKEKNYKRYWVPLQDYTDGHVFIINGKMVTDYKFGDVFLFDSYKDIHGSANISYEPRITLQIWEIF